MSKSVYVVGGDKAVERMFASAGWEVYTLPNKEVKIDLVCFTGGADVSPYLYGEENVSSYCDPTRDEFERQVYESYVNRVPFVGICRGGQFLNVMNGGKMIQHIGEHSMGHRKIVMSGGNYETIHEDHHQGIVPAEGADVIGFDERDSNVEVCYYPETRALCFQPHPEWGHRPTEELFFSLIEEYVA